MTRSPRHAKWLSVFLLLPTAMLGLGGLASPEADAQVVAAPAQASAQHLPPLAVANPQVAPSVIESLPAWMQQKSDLYIDSSYKPGNGLIYPDGTVVPGQSGVQLLRAISCYRSVAAYPVIQTISLPCSIFGSPGYVARYAAINTGDNLLCISVKGFRLVWNNRPPYGYTISQAQWFGGGCTWGTTYVNVPWGNVLATPQVQFNSSWFTTVGKVGLA